MINFRASNRAQDSLSIAVWDLDESPSRAEIDVLSRGSLGGDGGRGGGYRSSSASESVSD